MNKTVLGVGIGVLAIIIVGGVILVTNQKENADTIDHSQMDMQNESTPQTNPSTQSTNTSADASQTTTVEIKNYAYTPSTIKVKKGTSVTWTSQDSARHDVMPDDGSSDVFKASKLLGKGESYSFTFNTVGTYAYHCSPHTYMKATVEVTE